MRKVKSEDKTTYNVEVENTTSAEAAAEATAEDEIILQALEILESRMPGTNIYITAPDSIKSYLRLKIGDAEHEVFGVILLDNKHQILRFEEMFRGTIDGASVHPREVVKTALAHNAAAVIFYHNHPSGTVEPSQADIQITKRLKDALALVEIRVLDHFIVSAGNSTSLAERSLI